MKTCKICGKRLHTGKVYCSAKCSNSDPVKVSERVTKSTESRSKQTPERKIEIRDKISVARKKLHIVPRSAFQKGHRPWIAGRTKNTDVRVKQMAEKSSISHMGQTSLSKGFSFEELYGEERAAKIKNRIRCTLRGVNDVSEIVDDYYPAVFHQVKHVVARRDGGICKLCGKNDDICVHHINYIKQNCSFSNLVTLCRGCNGRVNRDRNYWLSHFSELSPKSLTKCRVGGIDVDSQQLTLVLTENNEFVTHIHIDGGKGTWEDRIYNIASKFDQLIDTGALDGTVLIAIEEPIMVQNPLTTMKLAEAYALVWFILHNHSIPYIPVGNRTWKKDMLGDGKIGKDGIREWVISLENFPIDIKEQHYYDSCVLSLWCARYGETKLSLLVV